MRITGRAAKRLSELTEEECYARCHGGGRQDVRIVRLEPRRPRYELPVTGEELRRRFEQLLDQRDPAEVTAPGHEREE